ncbi:MAG TPA: hypothetical protein VFA59_06110 [Vicinamibacterales bacterium]|nr:hypothetical protein [Vicinamibacterales bacterium]
MQPDNSYAWPLEPGLTTNDDWSAGDAADAPQKREWLPRSFAEWFALGLTFIPAILYLPGSQSYRLIARVAAYGISVAAFTLWWFDRAGRKETRHPAERWLTFVMAWLGLMMLNPGTINSLAGIAHVTLYFSILCPLFWTPAYITRRRHLVRLLAILLFCNGLNSLIGVAQVYDPDRWMPKELSPLFMEENSAMLAASTYIGPNGRAIIRPPGLFDTPGAVCNAGTIAAVLGLIFLLEPMAWPKRAASGALAVFGMAAIYLSHVRAAFVVTLGMMVVYVILVSMQQHGKRAVGFIALAAGIIVGAMSLATMLGGESVQERFMTLLADDPRQTYYQARGNQVEAAFTDLAARFPFGAGLARWGMAQYYFNSSTGGIVTDPDSVPFAEVQPNAWILDGGFPLLVLYGLALIATVSFDLRLIRSLHDPVDKLLAAIVVATNFGTLAYVFTFVPFGTTPGMQFWFLEGALHGAMVGRPRSDS